MDYTALSSRTLTLIEKYGRAATLSIFSPGTYNVIEGSYSGATFTDYAVNAILIPVASYGGRQSRPSDTVQLVLEEKIDQIAYVPASGLVELPSIRDKMKVGGVAYDILGVEHLKPATVSLLFTLFLRKG